MNNVSTPEGTDRSSANIEFVNTVAVENVKLNIERIKNESSVLNDMFSAGEIDIVSELNKGTTISISIPKINN
jgi:hypothetical protein